MIGQEILEKAIQKSEKNGFNLFELFGVYIWQYKFDEQKFIDDDYVGWDEQYIIHDAVSLKEVIFSHDFAKAFWGKQEHNLRRDFDYNELIDYCKCGYREIYDGGGNKYCWEYHLQQMVLEKEPLKYLEKFL